MLAEALQAEVDACIARFAAERGEDGRRLVACNGYHQGREVLTSAGAIEVRTPWVNDKRNDLPTAERVRFASAILPPWARKTPKITEVLPLLYLHGLSGGDFVPALGQFPGSSAGLSPAVITRLTETWQAEQRVRGPGPAGRGLCLPVGRWDPCEHPAGRAQAVLAGADRRPRRRAQGTPRPRRWLPGAGGGPGRTCCATAPPRHARPRAGRRRRCAGVLGRAAGGVPRGQGGSLLVPQDRQRPGRAARVRPPRRQEGPGRDLERRGQGPSPGRRTAFKAANGAKFAKAVAKITGDLDQLLAFYDYPAEHRVHLRTTNPIESAFATVRHRSKITKGPGSRAAGLAMAVKLIESAQDRWRAVNAPHLVALVRAGATFINGKLVERPGEDPQPEAT